MPWVLRMAWRDSRGRRWRLLLYTAAIAVGIAALTGLRGLSRTMEKAVDEHAATLLGADMEIESSEAFKAEALALIDSVGGRQARMVELNSMIAFPGSGDTWLAQVRALEGGFPFYGELGTDPATAARTWSRDGEALVDDGLMLQFGAEVGDTLRVGRFDVRIGGRLLHLPGETALRTDVRPVVFIPYRTIEQTALIQAGSRVEYKVFFQFQDGRDVDELASSLDARLDSLGADADTIADRKRRLGRTLGNLYRFLGLGSFVALLLGAVGVASAVHAHVQQKLETVAILRSIGATSRQTLLIYLVQATAMGVSGSLAGALVGLGFVWWLPGLLADFLPQELGQVQAVVSPMSLIEGVGVGAGISLLFAALPLLAVRRVSPLLALRADYENGRSRSDLLLRLLLALLAAGGTYLLAHVLTGRTQHALYFTGGTLLAMFLLAGTARLLRAGARRFFPSGWSYLWRQGLANLYRPHNQTLLLLVSLGLGTFLVVTLYTAQSSIIAHINRVSGGDQPNMVLFDIQTDQRVAIAELVEGMNMPVIQQVPVVPMRVAHVKGVDVDDLTGEGGGNWALRRQYRSTYRDHTTDTEQITEGVWRGTATDTVFVSLAVSVAAALDVGVGDALVFDVEGVPVDVVVGSLRTVDWQRIMPNFLVVFPSGALEQAPQFHVLVTRADDSQTRAALQRQAVRQFPNVSVIDLDLVLRTVDNVLDRVSVVVRLVSVFSVGTGLCVLVAVIAGSRFQRLRESALLRTLGASRCQVGRILLVEYLLLGSLAGLAGLLLALGGGWAVARFVFEITFAPSWPSLLLAGVAIPLFTVLVGLTSSRGIQSAPPLEVLRRAE